VPGSIGLVVEGFYDETALSEFVRRIIPAATFIRVFPCGGGARLMQKFPGYLDALQYEFHGGPVDKALVVVDSNGQNPASLVAQMQTKIAGRTYSFPGGVQFSVAVRELEAWLLGDLDAISTIPATRGSGAAVSPLRRPPETLADPKAELERRLTQRGVAYTSEVGRCIASAADLGVLGGHCPSFADFRQKVLDC
jgi:uncharacterized protein DUF4276